MGSDNLDFNWDDAVDRSAHTLALYGYINIKNDFFIISDKAKKELTEILSAVKETIDTKRMDLSPKFADMLYQIKFAHDIYHELDANPNLSLIRDAVLRKTNAMCYLGYLVTPDQFALPAGIYYTECSDKVRGEQITS